MGEEDEDAANVTNNNNVHTPLTVFIRGMLGGVSNAFAISSMYINHFSSHLSLLLFSRERCW